MIINKLNIYVKSTFFYILGNGVGQGLMLLSTIVFTRIMTKEGYGQYSTYYSFVAIMTTFIGASLNSSINNAYVDFKGKAREYRASVLLLASFVALGISFLFIVINLLFGSPFPLFLVIMSLLHSFSFFCVTVYNNSATMENKYIKKSILLMLPNILQISFSICFILFLPISELNARVIGSTLGVGVCAAFVYTCMIKGRENLVNKSYWKYGLKISVPLVFSAISYMIMSQSDNIMITAFKGADVTAVYALIYYIGFIIYAILEATNPVLQAWLYRNLDKKNVSNVRLIQKWYLCLYAFIAVFIMMISPELIKILSPQGYWEFKYIAPFVLASYIMAMYTFYSFEISFYKKTVYIAAFVMIAAVLNIILNSIYIPQYGGIAAAVASAVSYLVLFILLGVVGEKLYRNLFSKKSFIVFFLIVISSCLLFNFVKDIIILRYVLFLIVLSLFTIYGFMKRNEIISIAKK